MSTLWHLENQRDLMRRLKEIARRIAGNEVAAAAAGSAEPDAAAPGHYAIDVLRSAFRLSSFERDVLLLCAGVELDSAVAEACATANGAAHCRYATFSIALARLEEAHWSALAPDGPLRYWRLIDVTPGEGLTAAPLRIDESILHFLAGVQSLDPMLDALVTAYGAPADLVPSHEALAERVAALWTNAERPVVHLHGSDPVACRDVAATACAKRNALLHVLRASDLPADPRERDLFARLLQREVILRNAACLIDADGGPLPAAAIALLERLHGMVFVLASEMPLRTRGPIVRMEVNRPSAAEQGALWHGLLGERLNGAVGRLVSQFDLDARSIRSAARSALGHPGPEDIAAKAWRSCCKEARRGLDELAQRLQPVAGWSDLVLPPFQMRVLRDIASQVRCRALVYDTWGFAGQGSRGLGISALFAGASGTGKTMAAEVIARELELDLYRIDLSQVVSKYIGETEKNLRRVFDAAEASGAVLLFDECDALFGKRSEVRDSHDRYANLEISYLLQRMESYRGLAILTTNMKNVLDSAFLRRLRFIVQFPEPDSQLRAEIWRRVFPRQTPRAGLDVTKLARLNVTGGNIRNIAMHAAFIAADSEEPVSMAHVLRAARSEYAKLDRQLTEAECRDWV
jgi:hypothetical protein